MKKVIALFSIAVCFAATSAMAQGPGGQQMTPEQRVAMMKERVKGLNLGLTDVQTDSVVAIYTDRSYMNGINFREMADADRTAKMKEISDARAKRLTKAGLSEDQVKKITEGMTMRPGGGGRPGGQK
ncbi:hypothetical protein [Sediminibacterium soli]|uniref:hypothetical protein n=1 Tax=Sediminibacterium soli TaxID=2698829 RepID=UPI00137ABD8E|nr:hypothetical protein [Sediminibacterium soli]NCI47941.1 hypothetical protein [Sediminibacterium soli]